MSKKKKFELHDAFLADVRYTEKKGIEVLFSIPYKSGAYYNEVLNDSAIITGVCYQLKVPVIADKEFQTFVMLDRLKKFLPNPPVYRLTHGIDKVSGKTYPRPYIKFIGFKMCQGLMFEPHKATWTKAVANITADDAKLYINMYFPTIISFLGSNNKPDPFLIPRGYVPIFNHTKLAEDYKDERSKFILAYGTDKVAIPGKDLDLEQGEIDAIDAKLDEQRAQISAIQVQHLPSFSDSTSSIRLTYEDRNMLRSIESDCTTSIDDYISEEFNKI
jgi:hypothetical protein